MAFSRLCRRPLLPSTTLLAFILAAMAAFLPRISAAQESGISAELLKAVVGVRATIPMDGDAARAWGPVREGTGVVIDGSGLVLTVRHIIRRGTSAEIVLPGGEVVPAKILAFDFHSSFGLLRAAKPINVAPMRLGDSSDIRDAAKVLAVSHQVGKPSITPAHVIARQDYAAPNEYIIEQSLLTFPAHDGFSGAALVSENGRLIGIGALSVSTSVARRVIPTTLWLPINGLKPILGDLIEHGKPQGPQRPWLGLRVQDADGHLTVLGVNKGSPAEAAGLATGDVILGVKGKRVSSAAEYYRKTWEVGPAGSLIPLDVLRFGREVVGLDRMGVKSIAYDDQFGPGSSY